MNSKWLNRVLLWVLAFSAMLSLLSITWRGRPINLKLEEVEAQTPIGPGEFPSYGEKEIAGQVINLPKIRVLKEQDIIAPVTDPKRRVTDPVLLKELSRQGIDKDYVELFGDYAPASLGKEHSPYAQFYQDRKSGKRFMVTQGLPMVTADGLPIVAGWERVGNKFVAKNNLFKGTVDGNNVELVVKNDQPDGRKKNDKLNFHAQLFLNGVENPPAGGPTLLAVDPVNPNYQNNVLEWDYGIAKRRLRLIEGSVLGSWVFPQNPNGDVRIVYNQAGDYRLKLGRYAAGPDEERVSVSVFAAAQYPFEIGDSATYYPNAHPETTSVDGWVRSFSGGPGVSWTTIRNGTGLVADDTAAFNFYSVGMQGDELGGTSYDFMWRSIVLWDTSALPDGASVSAATASVYGYNKTDDTVPLNPDINIYTSTPGSNTALLASDWSQIGTTAKSTAITYSNFSTTNYNNFVLNDLTTISLTSISKFGFRNANYDVANSAPSFSAGGYAAGFTFYFSEQGTGYQPKLVVTYTLPSTFDALLLGGD